MKISLDVNQQVSLIEAYSKLDTYDCVVENKIVKVPYKLGAVRRSIVKNLNALREAAKEFDESRVALIKEIWPDFADGTKIEKEDDPEKFLRFQNDIVEMASTMDEFNLLSLPAKVMYADGSDFPNDALAILEKYNLIMEEPK